MRHLTLLLALLGPALCAQSKLDWTSVKNLPIGQEIRVTLGDGKAFRGQVQSVTEDTLAILAANTQQSLVRSEVKKIVTKGESHRGRNTLIGLGIGAGAGLGMGAGSDATCSPHCFLGNNVGKEILTPVGAVVGTIVGLVWPTGTWHEVYKAK